MAIQRAAKTSDAAIRKGGRAVGVAGPAAHPVVPASGRRDERVFGLALAVAALGLAVDAAVLLVRGDELSGVALLFAVALAPGLQAMFRVGGPAARAVLAAGAGLPVVLAGVAVHVAHAALDGPRLRDATGIAGTLAAAILVALAFLIGLRDRRRLVQVGVGLPLLVALAQWGVVPAVGAGLATSAPRGDVAAATSLGLRAARDVQLAAADGTRLAAWYVPGTNGAAVVVLHGSHGTRADAADHVRLLARAGYAVLAVDARGHGESGGATNALGWAGTDDVAGAVAFLQGQPGVDRTRIAALGLSMGAEEALRAAADGVALAAVVADGAGAATLGDQRLIVHGLLAPVAISSTWLAMRATELAGGVDEPAPLDDRATRIGVPVLLIASKAGDERTLDAAYAARIGARAALWYVPDAGHTAALDVHPDAYAAHVVPFLADALGPSSGR